MTVSLFYNLTGAGLFLLGFYSLFSRPQLLKKILSLNVSGAGLFLLMISTGFDPAGGPPDPVLQALVLTGIVIAVSVTAYGLVLGGRIQKTEDRGRKPEDRGQSATGKGARRRNLPADQESGSAP